MFRIEKVRFHLWKREFFAWLAVPESDYDESKVEELHVKVNDDWIDASWMLKSDLGEQIREEAIIEFVSRPE